MADFANKKLRVTFEKDIASASAEDLSLLIALTRPLLAKALKRIEDLSLSEGVQLDPDPMKAPVDGRAKD